MKRLLKWFNLKLKNIKIRISVYLKKPKYYKVPFLKRIRMKVKGFTPDHYYQYDFKNNNPKDYLTEVDRWKTRRVNGDYNVLMDDGLVFYHMFKNHVNIPTIYGWINNGQIYDINQGEKINTNKIFSILKEEKRLILKPNSGGGGFGITTLEHLNNEEFILNNQKYNYDKFENAIFKFNNYTISKYIKQDKYSNDIYDKTVNTIRVITIINEDGEIVIPIALHRFGTKETIPVDNASSGGIFSNINLETGILTEAKSYRTTKTFETHPNSKNKIKGEKVLNWDIIKQEVIKIASKFPYIPFMAWDIVPNKEGFYVLEINASSGLSFFQMFEPQKNSELGMFYRRQGVIK